ncbi:MAG: ABC transporter permease [Anaerolineae bacterium]|nr:ABC transporter permease [Thermoflexales bacterium]MDW8407059.1 ABC transporter permease [Anaerolineae bacterium]
MKKLMWIGLKDIQLMLRDRTALIFMLLAPFLLTIGLGLVTGQLGGGNFGGLEAIPIAIVNQDQGKLGGALVEMVQSPELAELVNTSLVAEAGAARDQVDANQIAAAIIVPPGFSDSIIPRDGRPVPAQVVRIEVYKNPARPVSAGIVQALVEGFISRVETGRVTGEVIVRQALAAGLITPQDMPAFAAALSERLTATATDQPLMRLRTGTTEGSAPEQNTPSDFNPMAYMAPGMALLFLMFTVSNGGRSLLAEQAHGTLHRVLVSPTTGTQVLVGKLIGTYLTGTLQMLILIAASSLLFNLRWGDPLGVLVLILACVFGALGWGMLITVLARTAGQVAIAGSAVMLIFGILGGSFIQLNLLPTWFQWLSKLTPNAWGLDGFTILGLGGRWSDLGQPVLGLLTMGVVLGALSIALFNRRRLWQR